jgi:hypothetical protein
MSFLYDHVDGLKATEADEKVQLLNIVELLNSGRSNFLAQLLASER